ADSAQCLDVAGNFRYRFVCKDIVDVFGVKMTGHRLISRERSVRIAVRESFHFLQHLSVFVSTKETEEIQTLLCIWRCVEPRNMTTISQEFLPDADSKFIDEPAVLLSEPCELQVIGVVERIEILMRGRK